jgi:uncharacterized glyoxalase superfamily protein PhnB
MGVCLVVVLEDNGESGLSHRRSSASAEDDAPHVEFSGAEGLVMGVDTEDVVRASDPLWHKPAGGQRVNLQFEQDSPAAVDSAYERLVAAGVGEYAARWDAFWGQRFGRVIDPDGNVVSLFAAVS